MDVMIKKRMTKDITVYPFDRVIRGDKTFKPPYQLKAYIVYNDRIGQTRAGEKWYPQTILYLEAKTRKSSYEDVIIGKVEGTNDLSWSPFTLHRGALGGTDRVSPHEDTEYEEFRLGLNNLNGRFVLGPSGKQVVQFTDIKPDDEVVLDDFPNHRIPVKQVVAYQGLGTSPLEIIEVKL